MQSYPNFPEEFPKVGQVVKVSYHGRALAETIVLSRQANPGSHDFQISVCINDKIFVFIFSEESGTWVHFESREIREVQRGASVVVV